MICTQCGFSNPGQFQFCGNCGQKLSGARSQEAERLQLTVMFFDLVGSTTLSGELDPEELRELILRYQQVCNQIIARYQGFVAQYLGDGILAYFGYPQGHNDDGRRAACAALDILAAMRELSDELLSQGRPRLDLRVGIHTGLVVVGELGSQEHREHLALGETPNVAARLQGLAGINEVVVGPTTYELIEGEFLVEELGPQALKGVSEPLAVYRLIAPIQRPSRVVGPFLGRQAELAQLEQHWQRAQAGQGHLIALWGQPGVGKTRLMDHWRQGRGLRLIASPEEQSQPWSALCQWLQALLEELPVHLTPPERLRHLLESLQLELSRNFPWLAQLLHLEAPDLVIPPLSPQAQRQETFAALARLLAAWSCQQTQLIIWDGWEWVDPSSREWLEWMAPQLQSLSLLVVLISRIEPTSENRLALGPLNAVDSAALLEMLLDPSKPLNQSDRDWLLERAAGIPYYIEELTRSATLRGSVRGIPAKLQDFLEARVDELGTAKNTAQQASVIGQSFSRRLLSGLSGAEVGPALQNLVKQGVVASGGTTGEWCFVQNLLREACYESLLISRRQSYHGQLAEILRRDFPAWAQQNPAVIGHHLLRSSQAGEAIPWLAQAVVRGLAGCSLQEAVEASKQGLNQLDKMPSEHPYQAYRLKFLTLQGSAWIGLRGYAAPEVETCFEQAHVVCAMLGDSLMVFPVLAGLWVLYFVKGRLDLAEDMSLRLQRVAQPNTQEHRIGSAARGQTLFFQGDFEGARQHLLQATQGYQPLVEAGQSLAYMLTEPSIASCSYLAQTYLMLGLPAEAEAALQRARQWCDQLDHPHTTAHTLAFEAWYWVTAEEAQKALQVAQELETLASLQAFPLWLAMAKTFAGSSLLALGQLEGGALLQEGLQRSQATGAQLGATWMLAKLGQVLALSGDSQAALATLEQARQLCQSHGENYFLPEILRLQAQLSPQAESLLQEAEQLAQASPWHLQRIRSAPQH